MKKVLQFLASVALLLSTSSLTAADTTPPTLDITHTWIEQVATIPHFKMYLDPRDETGMNIDNILFRSALNTSTIPATNPWQNMPWTRGEPFDLAFKCTSCVVEIRARDAAGNLSPVQKRYFASPFPYSAEPNLKPVLNPTVAGAAPTFSGYATDCRGLFSMQFDGQGTEDVVEVDRTTGSVVVRRELFGATTISSESITLLPNTITDSAAADLDGDGRAELVIATGGISLYHNDGLDVNGVVQFSPRVLSLTGTGIVTVQNIVLGDITGEGKPDVIISGTDANGDTRVGWIIKDDTWDYNAANGSPAPAGSSPGKLAVGDMNGDGKLDIVMVDAANNQMIIFKNKGQGVLAGDGEADVNYQPVLIPTGFGQAGPSPTIPSIAAPVRALAIADVTGDGRPDIVTIMTSLVFSNPLDSNDGRTQQRWRLYENRGTSIRPHTDLLLGQSPTSQTVEDSFQSSVLITEMGDDRFPEMVFTNYYDNSIKVIRFTPLLGSSNELTTLDNGTGNPELDEQDYVPPASGSPLQGPSRLASSKGFNSSKPSAIAMTFATSNVLRMLYFHTPSSKSTYTIEGGRTTDSDQTGLRGANGFFEYTAFAGEAIDHTLTATNNSDAALTGVFLDSTLAANESTPNANSDSNWTSVTISPFGKHVRYTVDIPAHSVVVKHYQTKILSGDVGSKISGTCFLRQGAANTKLASNAMPLVTLKDPIQFRCTVETQSDNSGGDTAHAEEWIAYRMTMTNLGQSTVTNARLNVTLPTNTTHLDHSADSVLGVTPIALVGNFSYEPWKPNQTIALNQQIIDHNNHLQKCVANGISGLTPPTWSTVLNGTTNDGTVQWKDMGLKSLTSFIWNGFDLPPDDPMTVGLENERTIEVRVKIKAGLPAGWKITRGTISFARSDGAKQSATAFTTTLLNPLEITLNSNKTNALPGETVRYTFSVTNHNFFSMSNCKVVDTVPSAMVFVESGANDGADSGVSGGTGNFNQFPGLKKNDATLTTNPSLDIANILTWNLGTIPARTARTIEFDLQVQCDVPNSFKRGVNDVVTSISNSSYNFVGNNTSGTRLFAATPALGTTGSTITIDQGTPLNSPSVYMFKSFLADGTYQIGGESYTTVINDPAVTTDGYCTASSFYGNTGAGAARNVVLHDVIPSGMNFAGSFTKSSGITMVPVTNFTGWHFFDATGKELLPGEAFTDSNNNGFYDVGEPYTDANGNHKFDGITATLVRSFDANLGTIAGGSTDPLGNGGTFNYQMQASTSVAGTKIESTAGGMSGSKDGVNYTALTGYYIRAENLRFPSNGNPEICRAFISAPAKVAFPMGTMKSSTDMVNNGAVTLYFPYEITGGLGVNLSDLKMDLDIAKGYSVSKAKVTSTTGGISRQYPVNPMDPKPQMTVTTSASTGITHVSFPLDGQRIAFPEVTIGINPATKSALLTNGVTNKPLTYKPVITGKWVKAAAPAPPHGAMARAFAAAPPAPPPTSVPLAATETFGTLPTLVDSTKDSRIFVARVAPMSVKRGDSLQYVIVVGNLTTTSLGSATITMKVPAGCRGINVSQYAYTTDIGPGWVSNNISPTTGRMDTVNHIRRWDTSNINTLLASNSTVTVSTGPLVGKETGVIFFTCYVPYDYVGDYIDDNSVVFDVPNACAKTPGPSRIAVRVGSIESERSSITAGLIDGIQLRNSAAVTNAINSTFTLTENSCHISFGGPDVFTMKNGLGMVPLPGATPGVYDRVLVIGPPSGVNAPSGNFLFKRTDPLGGPPLAVAVGPGNTNTGIKLVDPPSYSSGLLLPSDMMLQLKNQGANIVAGGGGNIVAAGGGNIVAAGGGNLSSVAAGASVVMPDGSLLLVSAFTDAKLIGKGGAGIVAGGGGNIVAAGGGNIVAAGGGNLIGDDGASVVANDGAGVVANDGAGLVGQDGSSIVAAGGGNIITVSTGSLIQGNGVTQGIGK